MGRCHKHVLIRQIEVFGIGILEPGLVPRLPGKPEEEVSQLLQRGVQRRLAQLLGRGMAASGSNILVSTGPRLFSYKMILKTEKNFGGQISSLLPAKRTSDCD